MTIIVSLNFMDVISNKYSLLQKNIVKCIKYFIHDDVLLGFSSFYIL